MYGLCTLLTDILIIYPCRCIDKKNLLKVTLKMLTCIKYLIKLSIPPSKLYKL